MAEYHRLKLNTEPEFLFQTIEMAKSDEEIDLEVCSSPPQSAGIVDLELVQQELDTNIFSWKVSKHRPRQHRRYTVSNGSPPAPPSTPTSLTASSTPTPSPTASNTTVVSHERFNNFYTKYKRRLKEQQRTDTELADLFSEFTITGGVIRGRGADVAGSDSKSTKLPPEHGVSAASRVIRKHDANSKVFKIHRNPKEFFRDLDEEDSVSAPEYETEEEDIYRRRRRRMDCLKPFKRMLQTRRRRLLSRIKHKERMDDMVDNFDATMSFNDD